MLEAYEWIKLISAIIILLFLFSLLAFSTIKIWQNLKDDSKEENMSESKEKLEKECMEIIRLYTHMFLRNDLYSMPKEEILSMLKSVKSYLLRKKMIPKELEDPFKNCDCELIYYTDFTKDDE